MDIAAMSIMLSQAKVQQQASISVMNMVRDVGQTQMKDIVQMAQQNTKIMEQAVTPHIGKGIDVSL